MTDDLDGALDADVAAFRLIELYSAHHGRPESAQDMLAKAIPIISSADALLLVHSLASHGASLVQLQADAQGKAAEEYLAGYRQSADLARLDADLGLDEQG